MSRNTWRKIWVLLIACLLFSCVPVQENNETVNEIKVTIDGESFYVIPNSNLKELGFLVDDYKNLALYNNQKPIPFWVDPISETEKNVIFYGEKTKSPYFNGNVYILKNNVDSLSIHPEIIQDDGVLRTEENSYGKKTGRSVIHIEKNLLYVPEAQGTSRWYWKTITSSNSIEVIFDLPLIQPGQIDMALFLWSGTTNPNYLDHSLTFNLNGHPIEEISWEGIGSYQANITISNEWFKENDNHLIIERPKYAGSPNDLIFFDAIDLNYSRLLSALKNQFEFLATGESHSIESLNGRIFIFDVTNTLAPTLLGINESSTNKITIKTIPDHHYLLMGTNDMVNPEISRLAESTTFFQNLEGGDYVVIIPEKIKDSLNSLIEYRQSQGHRVVTMSLQTIYDDFNDGIPDPMAINSFLKWANQEWKIKPVYILLVGDSSYDLNGFVSKTSENWLPPIYYFSLFGGETITDIPLTDLNDDGLPELALGRIPFSESDEIGAFINKLIEYENSINDHKEKKIQIGIAAETESEFGNSASDFSKALQSSSLENATFQKRIGFGIDSSREIIFENINDWLIYFGHGAMQMWGKENILRVDDLENELTTDFAPIVVNFTCLTGYFIHPEHDSITEELLSNEHGPIVIVAPTSLTLSESQGHLSTALAEGIASDKYLTIGELWVEVQGKQISTNTKDKDVLLTYLLFGDPATRLP